MWGALTEFFRLARLVVRKAWPTRSPDPRDVAIAVSSSEAAKRSSDATEKR
jgi:hypothetical protein